MHRRVTLATAAAGAVLTLLAGCGSDGSASETPPTSESPSATSSASPSSNPDAVALSGDWEIPAEQYVLHLLEDGTFKEDFQGVTDFRTGKYSVEGDKVSLVGDDGNTDEGTIAGDTLEFTLGTATRLE
jgi:hypothetical protein